MHAVRCLCCLALIAAAALPQQPPSPPVAALQMRLGTDKARYLQLEPVRLWLEVVNPSETAYVLHHHVPEPAARLRFYRVARGEELHPLGEIEYRDPVFCDVGEDLTKPRAWRIEPGGTMRRIHWYPNDTEPGEIVLRAAFEPAVGPDAGRKVWSDDVVLNVVAPGGADRPAYDFATSDEILEIGRKRYALSFRYYGFVSAGGRTPAVDGYFLEHFGDSLYADYLRYTISLRLSQYREEERRRELLRDLLARRSGFPLRRECYAHLMDVARLAGDIDEMDALAESLEHEKLPPSDSWVELRLERLETYLDELGVAGRRAVKRAFRNRRAALDHPLVASLAEAFGEGVRQRPEATTDSVWMYLSDRRASWPVRVGFRFSKTGALAAVMGSGALESWSHARFAPAIRRLKAKHGLDDASACKTFVQFELEGSRLAGSLQLPSGESREFTDRVE